MIICKRLLIRGIVQGVGFRAHCIYQATNIGSLQGWIRNLASGEVETLIQGESTQVKKLIEWCHHGPSRAVVESVDEFDEKVDPKLQTFRV